MSQRKITSAFAGTQVYMYILYTLECTWRVCIVFHCAFFTPTSIPTSMLYRYASNKLAYRVRVDFGDENCVYALYIYIIVQLIRNLEICEVYIILSLSFYKYLNKKVLKNDLLYIYIKNYQRRLVLRTMLRV